MAVTPRDEARAQYFRDWVDAICEDIRRELWDGHPSWWRRKRIKRSRLRVLRDAPKVGTGRLLTHRLGVGGRLCR